MKNKVHHKSAIIPFQWEKHSIRDARERCTMAKSLNCSCNFPDVCSTFMPWQLTRAWQTTAWQRLVCIRGVNHNLTISRINNIASHYFWIDTAENRKDSTLRLLLPLTVLYMGHMPMCCMADVLVEPGCQNMKSTPDGLIVLPLLSQLQLLLNDVLIHCTSCNRDMMVWVYEGTSVCWHSPLVKKKLGYCCMKRAIL